MCGGLRAGSYRRGFGGFCGKRGCKPRLRWLAAAFFVARGCKPRLRWREFEAVVSAVANRAYGGESLKLRLRWLEKSLYPPF